MSKIDIVNVSKEKVYENTVQDLFHDQYPEASKNLDENNCYDIKVLGPMSLDDNATILVMIQWKPGKTWHKYDINIASGKKRK